jgi:hypothetical protein
MSQFKEMAAFYTTLAELQAERDAAFATKAEDPERWQEAKHKYAEFRTGLRTLSQAGIGTPPSGPRAGTAHGGAN